MENEKGRMYKKKYKNGSLHVLAKMFNYEKEYLEKLGIIRVHGAKPFTMQRRQDVRCL